MRMFVLMMSIGFGVATLGWAFADTPKPAEGKKTASTAASAASDVELVERALAARREYELSLRKLREHYAIHGDKLRVGWTEQELMAFHLMHKPSYNLDVQDVPPPGLEAK